MKNKDSFSGFHPLVNFLYFALVLAFSMFFMHPVSLALSLCCAVAYHVYLKGSRAVRFSLVYMLPMLLLAAVINPAFNHEGATILTYLPSGNPLTLESIFYGIAAAMMLVCVISWFACYTEVMTSDKFVYLFGRIIPALSLVLSMTLRFVPRFKAQLDVVREAQRSVGREGDNGSLPQRIKSAVTVLSILITWSLENAIETADSMRSRGYGLPGRTAYSIYRFDARDRMALLWLGFCGFCVIGAWIARGFFWRWYPSVRFTPFLPLVVFFHLVYFALCFTPLAMDLYADHHWARIRKGEP